MQSLANSCALAVVAVVAVVAVATMAKMLARMMFLMMFTPLLVECCDPVVSLSHGSIALSTVFNLV